MRISDIRLRTVRVPMRGTFRTHRSSRSSLDCVVVEMATDEGPVGLGGVEPTPPYSPESAEEIVEAGRTVLAPALIGQDPRNVNALLETMDRVLAGCWEAKALLEMAAFDLLGKDSGLPVHLLLGGKVRDRAQLSGWIGFKKPEEAAAEATELVASSFRAFKIKVGGEPEEDRERVLAVRAAVGPSVRLKIDANEAYERVDDAVAAIEALASAGLEYCEQPVPRQDLEALAEVRRRSPIPIMADEGITTMDDLMAVLRAEAADYVKFKVMKHGGILKTLQMATVAGAAGIRCTIGHGFGLTLHTLAEVHVSAVARNLLPEGEMVGALKFADDVVADPIRVVEGAFVVPDKPGLGAALDVGKVERLLAS